MTAPPIPVPSQAKVEQLAQEYRDLEIQIEEKEKKFAEDMAPLVTRQNELKDILIEDVKQWGSAHAKKSKVLYGTSLEVMATFGSSSSSDGAAVEAFRLGLKKAGQTRLLKQIFEQTIRWDLKAGASKVIDAAHEAGKLPNKLFVLFARCTVTKDSSPRLEVRPRQQSQTA
jgi:hypothetical protein